MEVSELFLEKVIERLKLDPEGKNFNAAAKNMISQLKNRHSQGVNATTMILKNYRFYKII